MSLCWHIRQSHEHTKANLNLLLEAYHWHKLKREEVLGWNPEELHKKSFQNQVGSFLRKSVECFLYDNGLRHERVKSLRLARLCKYVSGSYVAVLQHLLSWHKWYHYFISLFLTETYFSWIETVFNVSKWSSILQTSCIKFYFMFANNNRSMCGFACVIQGYNSVRMAPLLGSTLFQLLGICGQHIFRKGS